MSAASTSLIVSLIGPDRPGLVEQLSREITASGGNWESSRMSRLSGQFAGMVHVVIAPAALEGLESRLKNLENNGMQVSVTTTGTEAQPESSGNHCQLEVVGQDRSGIVSSITAALASAGVNVIEFETECIDAPMSGGRLFKTKASLVIPPDLDPDDLQSKLEDIANDLMVEIDLNCSI